MEAKPKGHTLTGVETQSGKYLDGLPKFNPALARPASEPKISQRDFGPVLESQLGTNFGDVLTFLETWRFDGGGEGEGVYDIRQRMEHLDEDLSCRTVADRLASFGAPC